jgi:dipeptidyl aminopeptidase/acylaminoacyl peptidase
MPWDERYCFIEVNLVNALVENGIECEVHIFPKGQHGLSLADRQTGVVVEEVSGWIDMAIRWINNF